MKTSWLIGVMMLYMLILGCEMLASGGTSLSSNFTSSAGPLLQPSFTSSSTVAAQTWAVLTDIVGYAKALVSAILLWSPTVFTGYLLWFYWFICFPVACAMIFTIISVIRGIGSR